MNFSSFERVWFPNLSNKSYSRFGTTVLKKKKKGKSDYCPIHLFSDREKSLRKQYFSNKKIQETTRNENKYF